MADEGVSTKDIVIVGMNDTSLRSNTIEDAISVDMGTYISVGGGIIGCTTAYFLTRHPAYDRTRHRITLLESTKIAGGASGKAGGLLALWAYPKNIVPLSYRLHAQLAAEHGGAERWGYRRIHCGQLIAHGRPKSADRRTMTEAKTDEDAVSLQKRSEAALSTLQATGIPPDLDWVAASNIIAYETMGNPHTTAQVHPYLFTTSMAQLAEAEGVQIIFGRATQLGMQSGQMESVSYAEKDDEGPSKTIPASTVILAAGPWTRSIYPTAPISALRAHSVTIRPTRPVSAYALFTEITLPAENGGKRSHAPKNASPEIYARPDEVYACGEGDTLVPVPISTDLVEVDERRCQEIVDQVSSISNELRDGQVTARQACYLPNVEAAAAGPLIGETGVKGLLMATGHTCWGIQNAPATGKLISEIVFDGRARSANIAALDPQRVL